jgi:hypothetical protein
MTLLDRICRAALPLAVAAGLLSCEDPSEVGLSLNSDENQIGVFYEELVLPSTNYFIDSLRTDADRRLLVGSYQDATFGKTDAAAFSQLTLSKFTYTAKDDSMTQDNKPVYDYELDSAILHLRYNYFHSDNFSQSQSIEVRQIQDTLFSNVFYLSKFPRIADENSKLYGESTFQVNPAVDTVLKIHLNTFGQETIDYMRNTSVASFSGDSLINQLRGIALLPGTGNTGILGFDPTHADTKLSVYYKIIQVENVQNDSTITDSLSVDFTLANVVRYNSISTDHSTGSLNVPSESLQTFDPNDGKAYLQSATGIYPQVDLTPFYDFLEQKGSIVINRSDIELPVAQDVIHPSNINDVEGTRLFFSKDGKNIANNASSLVLSNISYLSSSSGSTPAIAELNDSKTSFQTEITIFTQLINSNSIDTKKLLLVPSDITSLNQSVFDKSGIKLKVYYTVPN